MEEFIRIIRTVWEPMLDLLPLKQDLLIRLIKEVCRKLVCEHETDDEEIIELCEGYWETPPGNNTVINIIDISLASKVVLSVLYGLIFVMALVGNIVVLVAFCSMRNLRNVSTNVMLINLAIADLLVTVLCMPFNVAIIHNRWWDFGALSSVTCKLVPYVQALSVVASILTLTCIAGERYVAVVLPLKARTMSAASESCRTGVLLVYIWLVALAFAVPNALWYTLIDLKDIDVGGGGGGGDGGFLLNGSGSSWGIEVSNGEDGGFLKHTYRRQQRTDTHSTTSNIPCDTYTNINSHDLRENTDQITNRVFNYSYCETNALDDILDNLPMPMTDQVPPNPITDLDISDLSSTYLCVLSAENTERMKIYQYMFFSVLFVAPLVMMLFMYSEVSYRLWFRNSIGNQSVTFDQMRLRTSKRVVTILVVVLILFVLCWAPLQIYTLVLFITSPEINETNLNLRYYFQWLALSNSAFNPLVYTFLHEKFRKTVQNGCCRKKNKVHTTASTEPKRVHTSEQQDNHGNSSNGTVNTNSSTAPTKY